MNPPAQNVYIIFFGNEPNKIFLSLFVADNNKSLQCMTLTLILKYLKWQEHLIKTIYEIKVKLLKKNI